MNENQPQESGGTKTSAQIHKERQQEFSDKEARKKDLWAAIADKDPAIRELTPEWKEIQEIDQRLMTIWTSFDGIKRKEN